jgi:uncharacterized protein
MSSLAVKLPLTLDSADGFTMIKDMKSLVKQNFKMLLLTNPGERVMDPEFGVGINSFLFENFEQNTYNRIEAKILEQVAIYLPVVSIEELEFNPVNADAGVLDIQITYSIPILNLRDLLQFTI